MSGEASWFVVSKYFTIAILSGQPVWEPSPQIQQQVKARFEPRLPAVEQAVLGQVGPLSLAEIDQTQSRAAPAKTSAVIDDRDQAPADHDKPAGAQAAGGAKGQKPASAPKPMRASVYLSVRIKSSGKGFNARLEVTAPVRKTALDALARSIAAALFPEAKAEDVQIN